MQIPQLISSRERTETC